MKYQVYFEIGNKKMQMEIKANSVEDAKYRLLGKINFIEVRGTPLEHLWDEDAKGTPSRNPIEEFVNGIMNGKVK